MDTINIFADQARGDLFLLMKNFKGGMKAWQVVPREIRMEQVLLPTQRGYKFNMYSGASGSSRRPSEILLNRNDVFFASYVGFRIGREDGTGAADLRIDNYPYHTHADANFFNGAAVGGATEAQSLQACYGGTLSCKTDTKDRLKPLSMTYFNWVPAYPNRNGNLLTQPNGADSTFDTRYQSEYGATMEKRGMKKLTPLLGFDGQQDNFWSIQLPDQSLIGNINGDTDAASSSGQGNKNVAMLVVYGWEVIQGADPIVKSGIR